MIIPMALWALKNWKVVLSGLVVAGLLALATGLYVKGRSDALAAQATITLKSRIALLEHSRIVTDQLMELDAARAEADAKELDDFDKQVSDLKAKLKDADRICLDGDDVDGLRDLWHPPKVKPTTKAPKRVL